jgi:hypothetical protein
MYNYRTHKKNTAYLLDYRARNSEQCQAEISEFLDLVAEFFACDDCDQPISFCSFVFHYRTQKEDGTCGKFSEI